MSRQLSRFSLAAPLCSPFLSSLSFTVRLSVGSPCSRSSHGLVYARSFSTTPLHLSLHPGAKVEPEAKGVTNASKTAFVTTFPFGLTNASATDSSYATSLDMGAPLLLRDTAQDFMDAARADAAALNVSVGTHLAATAMRCEKYLDSGEVHDRNELRRALLGVLQSKGQFSLLLGGKSVGKSLLLRELAKMDFVGTDDVPRRVVLLNARECGADLVGGLRRALVAAVKEGAIGGVLQGHLRTVKDRERNTKTIAFLQQALEAMQVGLELQEVKEMLPGGATSAAVALRASMTPPPNTVLLDGLLDTATKQGGYLCLLIDEGNLAFPSPPLMPRKGKGPSREQQKCQDDTKALLHHLVLLTKESRRINVLLSTSEYGYPYRLEQEGFFNTSNLTGTIFAGEVPPKDMRDLLLHKWGLGQRLADVFLAYYGGHVHMASQALSALSAGLDEFDCASVAPRMGAASVVTCLRSGPAARSLLTGMALAGFAEVRDLGDPAAQLVAQANVGGIVDSHATVVGVPFEVRTAGHAEYGMVPSAHFMRHIICKALHRAEKEAAGGVKRAAGG
jgi:hypothetical protein